MAKRKRKQKLSTKKHVEPPLSVNKKESPLKSNKKIYKNKRTTQKTSNKSLLEISLFLFVIAVIFLVNSLEPDNKGETGVVGAIVLFISIICFTYRKC